MDKHEDREMGIRSRIRLKAKTTYDNYKTLWKEVWSFLSGEVRFYKRVRVEEKISITLRINSEGLGSPIEIPIDPIILVGNRATHG